LFRGCRPAISAAWILGTCHEYRGWSRGRNVLSGHPDLLQELRAAIATKGQVAVLIHHATKRNGIEAALVACRIERQRLASKSAALLLRTVTAGDARSGTSGGYLTR
jgi:hypothetical protein